MQGREVFLWFKEIPDLDENQMKELDNVADALEVKRLLAMGVLKGYML